MFCQLPSLHLTESLPASLVATRREVLESLLDKPVLALSVHSTAFHGIVKHLPKIIALVPLLSH